MKFSLFIAIFFFKSLISYSKQTTKEDTACTKIKIIFERTFNNRVLVKSEDSIFINEKIQSKKSKVLELTKGFVIENNIKKIIVKVGLRKKTIFIEDGKCYIYIRRNRYTGKLIIEQLSNKKLYR